MTQSEAERYRPLSAGGLISQSLEGYRRLFRHLVALSLMLLLPGIAATVTAGVLVAKDSPSTPPGVLAGASAVALVVAVLELALVLALVTVAGQGYIGNAPRWQEGLALGFRRLAAMAWCVLIMLATVGLVIAALSVVAALLVGADLIAPAVLLSIVLAVAAIYVGVALVALPAVIVFEPARGISALRRSFSLGRGRWWATFVTMLGSLGLLSAAAVAAVVVIGLAGAGASDPNVDIGLLTVAMVLVAPLGTVAVTFLYFDLRNRREGLDLAELGLSVGVEPVHSARRARPSRSVPHVPIAGGGWNGPGPWPPAAPPWAVQPPPPSPPAPSPWGPPQPSVPWSAQPGRPTPPASTSPTDPAVPVPAPRPAVTWPAQSPKPPAPRASWTTRPEPAPEPDGIGDDDSG